MQINDIALGFQELSSEESSVIGGGFGFFKPTTLFRLPGITLPGSLAPGGFGPRTGFGTLGYHAADGDGSDSSVPAANPADVSGAY